MQLLRLEKCFDRIFGSIIYLKVSGKAIRQQADGFNFSRLLMNQLTTEITNTEATCQTQKFSIRSKEFV